MTRRDARGNPVSTASAAALDAAERALWRMMSFYGAPTDDLDAAIAADPPWPLPRLMKAGFLLSLTEPSLLGQARAELDAAAATMAGASEREQGHFHALHRLLNGDWPGACDQWQRLLDAHPRDALALQWSHLFDFYRGDIAALHRRPAQALAHWPADDAVQPYVLGLAAFGLEEGGRYAEAEAAGREALARQPRAPWAIHAVGHVMEMQGRHDEGGRWMAATAPQWAEGNGFSVHLGWHHALFALETLDRDATLALFDARLGPAATEITLQRLDAASLLWRCRLADMAVGERWHALVAGWSIDPSHAGYSTFNDLHAVLALLGDDDPARASAYVQAAEANVAQGNSANAAVMRDVGSALLRGLLAFGAGRFDEAVRLIAPHRDQAQRIGGSHAQRDLIEQTLLAAAAQGSECSFGRSLLAAREARRPPTPLDRHWRRRLGAA